MAPSEIPADVEKAGPIQSPDDAPGVGHSSSSSTSSHVPNVSTRIDGNVKRLERVLVKYHLEARGIQRVEDHEKNATGKLPYLQVFLLWFSINLAANNITLGMLGPAVYELSFEDGAMCAAFGSFLGSIPVAWLATWGPRTGLRTLVWCPCTDPFRCSPLTVSSGLQSVHHGMVAE